jgi:hypothetical protein
MVSERVKLMHDAEETEKYTDDGRHVSEGCVTDNGKKRESSCRKALLVTELFMIRK